MSTEAPNAATEERAFLAWLCRQAGEPSDTGALARGHLDGTVDLGWGASRETCSIRAAAIMARERHARLRALSAITDDGSWRRPPPLPPALPGQSSSSTKRRDGRRGA